MILVIFKRLQPYQEHWQRIVKDLQEEILKEILDLVVHPVAVMADIKVVPPVAVMEGMVAVHPGDHQVDLLVTEEMEMVEVGLLVTEEMVDLPITVEVAVDTTSLRTVLGEEYSTSCKVFSYANV